MFRKKLMAALGVMLLLQCALGCVNVQAAYAGREEIVSQGACVMDYETGEILYEYNGNVSRVPASMTKVMNMYCVYESLAKGEITLDTAVPISQNVYRKSRDRVYQSVVPLNQGERYTVDELMDIIIVRSASGASVAIAELLGGGSEAAFVERMNSKAKEMGINARYYDSCGIAENQITPVAMATLARNIIRDYPDVLKRSAQTSVDFHGASYGTTNRLLGDYFYYGADGLKTGSTAAAKYCLCATAVRDGRRIITVTMAAPTVQESFTDSIKLLDYGFAVSAEKYDTVTYTDIRTFLNGSEIPTLARRKGDMEQALVFAKDLAHYGFDVTYNPAARTTMIARREGKELTPLPVDVYHGRSGEKAFSAAPNSSVKVLLDDGAGIHTLAQTYNADGRICIAVEELEKIYGWTWDEAQQSVSIQAEPREPGAVLPDGERLTSKSAYIMDYDTGREIYAFDGDTQKPVASIAKMMSVYVILDALENGEIALDTVVPVSSNVYRLSRMEDYKMMANLEYGEVYTVDEMLDMIVVDSAAACVTAMAELVSGSEAAFVERMNAKAKEIGIGSVFYNGTGVCLDPQREKENLMSAKEVAEMARHMIQDYPEILERTKKPSVEFHGKTYYNLNKMFTDYYYEGADGFKNGMTDAAGYCMCGTAELDGKRVITVTLPSESNEARFTDTAKLFDYGFRQLGVEPGKTREALDAPVSVKSGEIRVVIDGTYEMQFPGQQPAVVEGRILLPVRALMETMGKTVEWDRAARQMVIRDESVCVRLSPGSDVMIKETTNQLTGETTREEIRMDIAPVIMDGRNCLPARAVAEAFGAAAVWDAEENTMHISAGVC